LLPPNRDKLLNEMRSIYEREHNTETITLCPRRFIWHSNSLPALRQA
jgi:hypothetical protein